MKRKLTSDKRISWMQLQQLKKELPSYVHVTNNLDGDVYIIGDDDCDWHPVTSVIRRIFGQSRQDFELEFGD